MGKYQQLAARIRGLPEPAKAVLAVVSTQRLMNHHLSLPAAERDPFIMALAPDLDKLWQALYTPSVEADAALQKLLKKRRSEPYASQIGKNNWQRGDDHPFAAARSALDTYCNGGYRTGAVMRLIDAARDMALAISESLGEDLTSDKAEARGEALARPEFNRVTSAVSILEREGVTTKSLDKLRKIFAGAGLGQSRAWEKRQARG